jgi:hypothetical protein
MAQSRKSGKSGPPTTVPLPSPSPATNLLIADIVLRSAGKVLRDALEQRMLVANYDPATARRAMDGRTVLTSIALYGASRIAARSGAGLAVVAGGLALKTLYDRGKARQRAQREADSARD